MVFQFFSYFCSGKVILYYDYVIITFYSLIEQCFFYG